ncbi:MULTISPECIES: DUF5797 family protein [Halobellus]|uniref:DUF5797 family protein n=1 Tax=Halobellus TaxID=1073986 RepID=UPI002115485A|nr:MULTISPECIES: DUF5797 family protein [Halobellus]MDQ2053580.1 DUF5797 family protein [Halobellus sp. H-GB7]
MTDNRALSEQAKERLADVVRLQPTKNKELQDQWGMESGSEVHQYLEGELKDYYYRDDNSLIRATAEAAELVDVEPGVEGDGDDEGGVPSVIRVPALESQVFQVVAGPDERSESVVSVLNKVRDDFDVDPPVEDVRRALQSLRRKGVVEVIYRTVPTFRLAAPRDDIDVEVADS